MSDAPNLKPCHSCGGVTILTTVYGKGRKYWGVLCNGCDEWIERFDSEPEAIAAWNTRTDLIPDPLDDPRVLALVEAAKNAIVSIQEAKSVVVSKREHQVLSDAVSELRAALSAMKGGGA